MKNPPFLAIFSRLPLPRRWRFEMEWRVHYWWLKVMRVEITENDLRQALVRVKAKFDRAERQLRQEDGP